MQVKLVVITSGTEFRWDGATYLKGSMCKGFGDTGETFCSPKLGGKIQTDSSLGVWISNGALVTVEKN